MATAAFQNDDPCTLDLVWKTIILLGQSADTFVPVQFSTLVHQGPMPTLYFPFNRALSQFGPCTVLYLQNILEEMRNELAGRPVIHANYQIAFPRLCHDRVTEWLQWDVIYSRIFEVPRAESHHHLQRHALKPKSRAQLSGRRRGSPMWPTRGIRTNDGNGRVISMLARRGPLVNNLDASWAPFWGLCLRARSGEMGNAQSHVRANVYSFKFVDAA